MFFRLVKLSKIISTPYFFKALTKNVAAGVEHKSALKLLGDCKTVIDIGANRGQFALIARHCFKDANIISFEPLDGPASIFENLFMNDNHTKIHNFAIGQVQGEEIIHLSNRDDSSSLLPIGNEQASLFPETKEIGVKKIKVAPLSFFIDEKDISSPAILKIDVQGSELTVLKGCGVLLKKFKYLYVECSFIELYEGQSLAYEVIEFLGENDFNLCGVYNIFYDNEGRAIQADLMFSS